MVKADGYHIPFSWWGFEEGVDVFGVDGGVVRGGCASGGGEGDDGVHGRCLSVIVACIGR